MLKLGLHDIGGKNYIAIYFLRYKKNTGILIQYLEQISDLAFLTNPQCFEDMKSGSWVIRDTSWAHFIGSSTCSDIDAATTDRAALI